LRIQSIPFIVNKKSPFYVPVFPQLKKKQITRLSNSMLNQAGLLYYDFARSSFIAARLAL
jgi:hypothetical protein